MQNMKEETAYNFFLFFLLTKLQTRILLGEMCWWAVNIKIDLNELRFVDVSWLRLTQDWIEWQPFVITELHLWVAGKAGISWTSLVTRISTNLRLAVTAALIMSGIDGIVRWVSNTNSCSWLRYMIEILIPWCCSHRTFIRNFLLFIPDYTTSQFVIHHSL